MGLCVGDALGVPFEFRDRLYFRENPVEDMIGFGTHAQPPGTWSDDSSLTFCLAESLCNGYNLKDIANKIVQWYTKGYWTANGNVFDVGHTTLRAIDRLQEGVCPKISGGKAKVDNGNGSLMRILPLAFYLLHEEDIGKRYKKIKEVSSITHAHTISIMCCFIYVEFAIQFIKSGSITYAMDETIKNFNSIFRDIDETQYITMILSKELFKLSESDIYSTPYVVDTIGASLWCIYNSSGYKEAVLKAVNLGGDTDTIGAITGGLAGIIYGYKDIPGKWINLIARKEDIYKLCENLYNSLYVGENK